MEKQTNKNHNRLTIDYGPTAFLSTVDTLTEAHLSTILGEKHYFIPTIADGNF